MKEPLCIWLEEAADEDFKRARNYLSLRFAHPNAAELERKLREAGVKYARPDDILQAARLSALPPTNPIVRRELREIVKGERRPPIMVVQFSTGCDIVHGIECLSASLFLEPRAAVPYLQARP